MWSIRMFEWPNQLTPVVAPLLFRGTDEPLWLPLAIIVFNGDAASSRRRAVVNLDAGGIQADHRIECGVPESAATAQLTDRACSTSPHPLAGSHDSTWQLPLPALTGAEFAGHPLGGRYAPPAGQVVCWRFIATKTPRPHDARTIFLSRYRRGRFAIGG